METQNYKHFEFFFIRGICKSDMGYLGTIYIVHIHFAVNRYLDFKMVNFSVVKIGFQGDRFVARQHIQMAYFIFH